MIDPFGLINFGKLADQDIIKKIGELAYNNKRLPSSTVGTHGVIHRIREQITGAMRPPHPGWDTHDTQIKLGLQNIRDGMAELRRRGKINLLYKKYPNINKVATMNPPKPTDKEVPKICR